METFELTIEDFDDGIYYVSLVSDPAVCVGWQMYSNGAKTLIRMSDEEQHLITGVVMIPDAKIYRYDGNIEYFVYYSKETIRKMAEKMLRDGTGNFNDTEHNRVYVEGINLLEVFIKDEAKGIVPNGFEHLPDGTLFATYHVDSISLWEDIKNNKYTGFSLEGLFTPKDGDGNKENIEDMTLKERLSRMLATFGKTETAEGVLTYKEAELAVGVSVYADDELTPMADGEYHTEDSVITVADGKVIDIVEAKAEEVEEEEKTEDVTFEEEKVEEEPVEEPKTDYSVEIDTLKADIDQLKNEIDGLKAIIKELEEKPATPPIVEEFENNKKTTNKTAEVLRNLRK